MANRFSLQNLKRTRYFDSVLLVSVALLLVFGLVMLYSVSSYDGNVTYGDSAYFFKKQLTSVVFGLVAMLIVSVIPYRFWQKLYIIGYGVAFFTLLLIIPFGRMSHGAKRWLMVAGFSIQPAEIAKAAIIITLAVILCRMGTGINTWKGLLVTFAPALLLSGMIYVITNNLSSAIIVVGIAFAMCYVASSDYKRFIGLVLTGSALAALFVFLIVQNKDSSLGYRGERVLAWLDPNAYASGKGFQILQSLYAIGSGGYMGKGIGESMQKLGYIPEAQNDMIFSIICEELGFVGAICVIALFLILVWRCFVIANSAPDMFGALLVVGVMAHIAIQVILNIGVVTNTIPNTGISLPFISYGGSSVLFLLIEIGFVLSVSRSIYYKE